MPRKTTSASTRPLPSLAFPPAVASLVAAGSVVAIVLVGVVFTLAVSWALSRTILKGEASVFSLELPTAMRRRDDPRGPAGG